MYGARLAYESPPVLAPIFPAQTRVRESTEAWARSLERKPGTGYVVVAHTPREVESYGLPGMSGHTDSVRNERTAFVKAGIEDAGLRCQLAEVLDYSAARAFRLVRDFADAVGSACLSDEIAIATLQNLEARGIPRPSRHVLGLDDSRCAREFGISIFSQHLPLIGQRLTRILTEFLPCRMGAKAWPAFREEPIEVDLIAR